MSRWADTFARLSGGSDTMDKMGHCAGSASTASHCVYNVMAAPARSRPVSDAAVAPAESAVADAPIPAVERAAATWSSAEAECAAIAQFEAGIPRDWAEGFARLDPERPPGDMPLHRWQRFVDNVERFLDSPFCAIAAALGWGPHDLFGRDRDRPFARIDQAGLLWLLNGDKLIALAANTATIETRTGARQTYRRKPSAAARALAWDHRP